MICLGRVERWDGDCNVGGKKVKDENLKRYSCKTSKKSSLPFLTKTNQYIITWMLHQIYMFSDKVMLVAS